MKTLLPKDDDLGRLLRSSALTNVGAGEFITKAFAQTASPALSRNVRCAISREPSRQVGRGGGGFQVLSEASF